MFTEAILRGPLTRIAPSSIEDFRPGLAQFAEQRLQMAGHRSRHPHIAAGHGGGDHEGPGLDAVGHDRMLQRASAHRPLRSSPYRCRRPDAAPHLVQRLRQFDDLRLAGGVFQNRFPFGQGAAIIRFSVPPTVGRSK